MKRAFSIFLAAVMALTLAACGSSGGRTSSAPPAQTPEAPPAVQPPEKAEAPAPAGEGKILVAYFSATGSTEQVAQTIADTLGADLFAITPAEA